MTAILESVGLRPRLPRRSPARRHAVAAGELDHLRLVGEGCGGAGSPQAESPKASDDGYRAQDGVSGSCLFDVAQCARGSHG